MQNGVISEIADPAFRAYVIWVPMFRGQERDVPKATREVPDERALHYWDGGSVSMRAVRATLGVSEDAWDIFLLYAPGVTWTGENPPPPAYWMHQLGSERSPRIAGPYLDPEVLLARARELTSD